MTQEKSPIDVLSGGDPAAKKALREEVFDFDLSLKNIIREGLAPDEFAYFDALRKVGEAALAIVDSVSD
ncbi:MAG: hypothetical protein LBJ64_05255 [Deltaproteobacteria bacterium]|jgi:hypothetical protein|nr:hypothetical protein [Deltaproteobacteria bacterium]